MNCKNCKSKRLKKPNYKLKKYSLDLYECEKCRLVQFSKLPPLEEMYGETYGYRTLLSPLMINHMKNKFKKIIEKKITKKYYNKKINLITNYFSFEI